jgi:hypothetical protein
MHAYIYTYAITQLTNHLLLYFVEKTTLLEWEVTKSETIPTDLSHSLKVFNCNLLADQQTLHTLITAALSFFEVITKINFGRKFGFNTVPIELVEAGNYISPSIAQMMKENEQNDYVSGALFQQKDFTECLSAFGEGANAADLSMVRRSVGRLNKALYFASSCTINDVRDRLLSFVVAVDKSSLNVGLVLVPLDATVMIDYFVGTINNNNEKSEMKNSHC